MTCDLRGQRILRVSTWVVSSENRGVSQFQWILIIFAIPTAILGVTPHLQMDPNLISSWLVASQCISIYFEKKVQKQLPNETPIYGIIYIYILCTWIFRRANFSVLMHLWANRAEISIRALSGSSSVLCKQLAPKPFGSKWLLCLDLYGGFRPSYCALSGLTIPT